jgi:DNA polymerase-3 subunit alpha
VFDQNAQQFFLDHFDGVKVMPDGKYGISTSAWDKIYQKKMDNVREWLSTNQKALLNQMNGVTFLENWKKYAGKGNISKWEMESLSFYYHEHELSNLDDEKYGVVNFFDLNEEPDIEYTMKRREAIIPIYKIYKIAGTCIAKNKNKSTISLLTNDGVVNVKFRKEYFSLFDKQISEKQFDGKKKVMEKSWFTRGNMLLIQGIRRGDDFIVKKYNATGGHQLYKILDIDEFGDIVLQEERYKGEYEDEPV